MTYYYETHIIERTQTLQADNDGEALSKLKERFGEHLKSVMIVYVEESLDNMRTVWME